jgi:hypothetical protein
MAIVVLALWAVTAGAGSYLLLTSSLGRARLPRPEPVATPAAHAAAAALAAPAARAASGPQAAAADARATQREMRRAARARFDTPSLVASRKAPMLPGVRSVLEFAHPACAIVGLGFWFGYTFVHPKVLAWIAFGLVAATACLGLGWLSANLRAARRHGPGPVFDRRLIALHGAAAAVTVTLTALIALIAHG